MDYQLFSTAVFFIVLLVHDANGNCNVKVEKVGCFNDDTDSRLLDKLLIYRRSTYDYKKLHISLPRLICDCARKARFQGFRYIGIQFFAECWSSSLKEPDYDREGKNEHECYNATFGKCSQDDSACTGSASVNYIYKVVYQDEVTPASTEMTTKTPSTTVKPPCQDKSSKCPSYQSFCTNKYPNMLQLCRKTCQQCV
ncbi:uncharacterized protein LOC114534030 [Dendronephthya gigantea]|uniref:uncharacterized protein LOC114534030 n=1 Tax=Dendronephthya gigantea TaxID=151771 RepID=UPI00106A0A36|nr:uncharacterized protein LOC114534030 [Dendronephthya gigantea]